MMINIEQDRMNRFKDDATGVEQVQCNYEQDALNVDIVRLSGIATMNKFNAKMNKMVADIEQVDCNYEQDGQD